MTLVALEQSANVIVSDDVVHITVGRGLSDRRKVIVDCLMSPERGFASAFIAHG